MTQQRLQALFAEYNRAYFAGRLPAECEILIVPERDRLHGCTTQLGDLFVIRVVSVHSDEYNRQVLLHEMAHASDLQTYREEFIRRAGLQSVRHVRVPSRPEALDHGAGWQREMRRLARDHGEQWALDHLALYPSAIDILSK